MTRRVEDRPATHAELVAHWDKLVALATEYGLTNLRLRRNDALVLTSARPGYRKVAGFVNVASEFVGAYVYVVTDDTPGLEETVAQL
jgi:hypothetical protein